MSVSPPKSKSYLQELQTNVLAKNGKNGHQIYGMRGNLKGKVNKKLKMDIENVDILNISSIRESKFLKKKQAVIESALQSTMSYKTKVKKRLFKNLNNLPTDLHFIILSFLEYSDIVTRVQNVNNVLKKACNAKYLWQSLNEQRKVPLGVLVKKTHCIVERRSKGKLYRGVERLNGNPCTLRKIYLDVTNAGHDDGVPTSILRELSLIKGMDHPNIAQIVGAEVKGQIMQISFQHYDYNMKEYMKTYIEENRSVLNNAPKLQYKMPLDKIKIMMFQMLQAVSFCHHRGIMHRNLKIDNLLLTKGEILKLADFSLCRAVQNPTKPYTPEDPKERERSGREARRLWYRAPELLFRKEKYSLEVDMWSVGCLLAEIAMGEPLFNGSTEIEQLFKIFRMTGVPDSMAPFGQNGSECPVQLPKWKRVYFGYIAYPKNTIEFKNFVSAYMPGRETALTKLVELKDRIGAQGLNLLWRLLEVDPQQRITAGDALRHPFFADILHTLSSDYINSLNLNTMPCCNVGKAISSKSYSLDSMSPCHTVEYTKFLCQKERELRISNNYMESQGLITESMRSILVDWLVDVSVHFEVMSESLHFAVTYIDRVLSKSVIDKAKLQLVGVTCMKIADVFNENSKEYYRQENSSEYAFITADEYTAVEVINMEKELLGLLSFELFSPTVIHFIKIYSLTCKFDDRIKELALYIADLMLLNYQTLAFLPSLRASAILFLAMVTLGGDLKEEDRQRCVQEFGWYEMEEFMQCVTLIRTCWVDSKNNPFFSRFDAVNNKHESQQQHGLNLRSLWPPAVPHGKAERWFYESAKVCTSTPMEIF